jgi:hypothetical protein
LLHGSEIWTVQARDTRRITPANTWEEQQEKLGQITKQMHKLQRS